jgi:hypothetical protein
MVPHMAKPVANRWHRLELDARIVEQLARHDEDYIGPAPLWADVPAAACLGDLLFERGEWSTCAHISGPSTGPAVLLSWAWHLACLPCAEDGAMDVAAPPAAAWRCDACNADQALVPVVTAVGPLLVVAAVCRSCRSLLSVAEDRGR